METVDGGAAGRDRGRTAEWREAFECFEQMAVLEGPDRERAMADLATNRPAIHPRVVALLEAAGRAGSSDFLDEGAGGAFDPRVTAAEDLVEGADLGPYRLETVLGEGGMGIVWRARRADGLFDAPVALKLLHPHLQASAARDRFTREGRILGQLSHPNIARLLDAGLLPGQRLYLALEYVEGERLDRWCDVGRLTVAERVRLFLQVCEAVAHAHARLIVHRDLKPSNILVTAAGDIKLLDFGIAKLIEPESRTSESTELTRIWGNVLTPEYAAPEQMSGAPITTAADVYALGVVLFVLLTGKRPYVWDGTSSERFAHHVLEHDPPAPSVAAGIPGREDDEAAASLRGQGGVRTLRDDLSGDLDTIILKALKRVPEERYASVAAFADDLQRFLDHQPVLARPDSIGYRFRKYVRRHRAGVLAAAAFGVAVIAGLVAFLFQAEQTQRKAEALARREQELQEVVAFQGRMLTRVEPRKFGDRLLGSMRQHLADDLAKSGQPEDQRQVQVDAFAQLEPRLSMTESARQALESSLLAPAASELDDPAARRAPRIEAALRDSLGNAYTSLGFYALAMPQFDQAIELLKDVPDADVRANVLRIRSRRVQTMGFLGDPAAFMKEARSLEADSAATLGPDDPLTLKVRRLVGSALLDQGNFDEGSRLLQALYDQQKRVRGVEATDTFEAGNELAIAFMRNGKWDEAVSLTHELREVRRRVEGPDSNNSLGSWMQYATALQHSGRADEAVAQYRPLLEARRRTSGDLHPDTLAVVSNLGQALWMGGHPEEGLPYLEEALNGDRKTRGDRHPMTLRAMIAYADLLVQLGQHERGLSIAGTAIQSETALYGPEHPEVLFSRRVRPQAFAGMGRYDDALTDTREILELATKSLGPLHPYVFETRKREATYLAKSGRTAEGDAAIARYLADIEAGMAQDSRAAFAMALRNYVGYFEDLGRGGGPEVQAVKARHPEAFTTG